MIILTIMTNIIPNIDINLEYVQNQIGIITTDLDSMIQVDTIFLEFRGLRIYAAMTLNAQEFRNVVI